MEQATKQIIYDKSRSVWALLISSALCSFLFAQSARVKAEDYESYRGETCVDEFVVDAPDGAYKQVVEIYPKEIYFGDPVYIVSYGENISDKTIKPYCARPIMPMDEVVRKAEASSKELARTYVFRAERPAGATWAQWGGFIGELQPDQKLIDAVKCLEFPPLEDWEDPFWQELRGKMTPDGVACALTFFVLYYDGDRKRRSRKVSCEILIKPRPGAEIELLDRWYNETPKELFPIKFGNTDFMQCKRREPLDASKICLDGLTYDPRLFVRVGYRKPGEPNNPTTVEGWRELESAFAPSVLRDEIRYTRLLLEYLSSDDNDSNSAKTAVVDFLNALPRAQRSVLWPGDHSRAYFYEEDHFKLKMKELKRAIDLSEIGNEYEPFLLNYLKRVN